jgi:peptide/nickel transport system ATP-binding protein
MSMDIKAPLLSIEHLTLALPGGADRPHAVRDISLKLEHGEVLCLVGESGSGKSMLAGAVTGLLPHGTHRQTGRIVFRGEDLTQRSASAMREIRGRDISMIFQEPMSALNPLQTIGSQIEETMRVHGVLARRHERSTRAARVVELLELVGLPQPERLRHAYPFSLSGGQRQRVLIAIALVLEPSLLIADEPTTALDVTTQAKILELIRQVQRKRHMGILFITHDFGVVAEIADRVAVLERGVLVEYGEAHQVLNHPRHPYTRQLIDAIPHGRFHGRPIADDIPVLLDVQGLKKAYPAREASSFAFWRQRATVPALSDVSFTLRRGETLGIVGESGSGKSTLARALLRFSRVESGHIRFEGQDFAHLANKTLRPLRRHIQMVFQDPVASLNSKQTVGQIIAAGPIAYGVPPAQAYRDARDLLTLIGLPEQAAERYPHQFSGGQRQRISIARALALEPKILVADEAVSGLDVSVQAHVLELLQTIQQKMGMALIFITHDLRVAAQICHRIVVMRAGQIVETGEVAQILESPQHPYTQQLIGAIPGRQSQWGERTNAATERACSVVTLDEQRIR